MADPRHPAHPAGGPEPRGCIGIGSDRTVQAALGRKADHENSRIAPAAGPAGRIGRAA